MTRETKIGMTVAGSFLSLVGAVVGTKMYKGDIPTQALDGLVANSQDSKKDVEISGTAKPQTPPATLPVGFLNTNPMPPTSSGFPQNPTDTIVPPAPPLPAAANFNGDNLPKFPDATAAFNNTIDDIKRKLEEQKKLEEDRLRTGLEQGKKEFANAGNTIIGGVKKDVGQFKEGIQKGAQNAIDSLPTLPPADPSNLTFPPLNVADNTIVGGKKPSDPLPSAPTPPNFNGVPPSVNEAPKTTIVGGKPDLPAPTVPPATPNFTPQTNTAPSAPPFGNDPIKPPLPPGNDLPQIPKDTFPPVGNPTSPAPFGNPPPVAPTQNPLKPAIETPPTTIVAPRPNADPLPPVSPLPNQFPSAPPPTSPQGSGFTPAPPFGQSPPTVTNPTTPPPFDPTMPPSNPGFAPIVQPTPVVKTDNSKRYTCQGNENYALISYREYGSENFARALEEYNRDLPTASEGVRAQPSRLSPGAVIMVPSQNYLVTHERYARLVSNGTNLPPVASQTSNPRPFGNDVGISPPVPNTNVPRQTTVADAGTTMYRVPAAGMYLSQVAERQLGSALRWIDIYRLNPGVQPEQPLREGMEIRVPAK